MPAKQFSIFSAIDFSLQSITIRCERWVEIDTDNEWNCLSLVQVFLDEPCLLHTADVQAAFIHLAIKQGDPKMIPAMNQRFYPNKVTDQLRTDHKLIPNRRQAYLETVGVKDISLTLSIPASLHLVKDLEWQKQEYQRNWNEF